MGKKSRTRRILFINSTLEDVVERFRDKNVRDSADHLSRDIAYELFRQTKDNPSSKVTAYQLWEYAEAITKVLDRNYLIISRSIGRSYLK